MRNGGTSDREAMGAMRKLIEDDGWVVVRAANAVEEPEAAAEGATLDVEVAVESKANEDMAVAELKDDVEIAERKVKSSGKRPNVELGRGEWKLASEADVGRVLGPVSLVVRAVASGFVPLGRGRTLCPGIAGTADTPSAEDPGSVSSSIGQGGAGRERAV
jgi:hypothetical protein